MVDLNQYHNKKIAVSALDWGMGHMTRLVTLMQKLKGVEWIIAATKTQEPYYKHYFPQATIFSLPPLDLQWSGKKSAVRELFEQKNLWRAHLKSDKKTADEILIQFQPDIFISDNRYGFYSEKKKSICITHQTNLPGNFIEKPLAFQLLKKYFSTFDEIWIPDSKSENLSGSLSTTPRYLEKKSHFIGTLPRFVWNEEKEKSGMALLLSGPEPQRRNFLKKILDHKEVMEELTVISPVEYDIKDLQYTKKVLIAPNEIELQNVLNRSKSIIFRGGYSSIMELYSLKNTRKIIVPTPGQREQEYLGQHHHGRNGFSTIKEKELGKIDLKKWL